MPMHIVILHVRELRHALPNCHIGVVAVWLLRATNNTIYIIIECIRLQQQDGLNKAC